MVKYVFACYRDGAVVLEIRSKQDCDDEYRICMKWLVGR
jgi:hypothetical protein